MLLLLPVFLFQNPGPLITANEAIRRVDRVLVCLRERAQAQGAPEDYFESVKPFSPPGSKMNPPGATLDKRLWSVEESNDKGYWIKAEVDANDGVVCAFSWSIPNYGKWIAPVKKRPSGRWFLARVNELASVMGVMNSLQIDRIEPDENSGQGVRWRVSLTQTYRGVPFGEAEFVIDGRYGLLSEGSFGATPNPPRSVVPGVSPTQAIDAAKAYVESHPPKISLMPEDSKDPFIVLAMPKLQIQRSEESETFLRHHAYDPYPGLLIYHLTLGRGRYYAKGKGPFRFGPGPFYRQVETTTVDAQSARVVNVSEFDPASLG